jgi:hypothetical protein
VARRRLLHVPRDEPRPTQPRRTVRLDLQPELRGAPGEGWSDPPRLAGGCRRHRHRRHLRHAVRVRVDR